VVGSTLAGVPLNNEVLSLNIAKAVQFLEKRSVTRLFAVDAQFDDIYRRVNKRDALHLCRLLRSCNERPSCRATEQRNEIAALHVRPQAQEMVS
jgi:hypothetical protein